ncbi:VrrA/YqfQ family protein [Alkalihalobacillus pseudalcaliphilus]|uniref:VrrA/YqfQ family protein n=1 Tax=Alkalihalobacillus pseudalcaliphilus TaxID=79884 RepID=UPI00064D8DFE|nr:VrrA/YqfQ family protein [Alkalihalobacillus pseudalcaliphilus]KMK75972.1 hypothetical protein AB990_12040 [Alkalihalobacillus pseudalcaliphilus]
MSPFMQMPMQAPMMLPNAMGGAPFMGGSAPYGLAAATQGAARQGGLLSRLFGGLGGGNVGTSGLTKAAGSSLKFSTIIDNSQRILGLTQQVMPMVRQYGPIIRNLPTMWRIMRSSDDDLSQMANQFDPNAFNMDNNGVNPLSESEIVPSTIAEQPSDLDPADTNTVNSEVLTDSTHRYSDTTKAGIPLPKLYV